MQALAREYCGFSDMAQEHWLNAASRKQQDDRPDKGQPGVRQGLFVLFMSCLWRRHFWHISGTIGSVGFMSGSRFLAHQLIQAMKREYSMREGRSPCMAAGVVLEATAIAG